MIVSDSYPGYLLYSHALSWTKKLYFLRRAEAVLRLGVEKNPTAGWLILRPGLIAEKDYLSSGSEAAEFDFAGLGYSGNGDFCSLDIHWIVILSLLISVPFSSICSIRAVHAHRLGLRFIAMLIMFFLLSS